jgi:hypothetical protein
VQVEPGVLVAPGGDVGTGVEPTHCAAIHAAHVCVFARQAPIHPPQNICPGGHVPVVGVGALVAGGPPAQHT